MNKIFAVLGAAILVIVFVGLLMSLPVMLLWDWLMPELFGLKEITWLQAWGILVLCGLLFKTHVSTKE